MQKSLTVESVLNTINISTVIIACKGICIALLLLFAVLTARSLLDDEISILAKRPPAASLVSAEEAGRAPKANYRLIASKNIFGPVTAPTATPRRTTPTVKPTTLPLQLIGTFVSRDEPPYAIIENKKNKDQDVFRIGESVFNSAKLVGVYEDRVEIERNGQTEILALDLKSTSKPSSRSGVTRVSEDYFEVAETDLDSALDNLPLLLSQARAIPYFKDGQSIGLRLFAIKKGSLYEKIGLKNGDILKSINGQSLADPTQALKLFEQLKEERSISLTLERNRKNREFRYEIR